MKSYNVTIQVKAIEHYFRVVLFITVQGGSVDEILECYHSNGVSMTSEGV